MSNFAYFNDYVFEATISDPGGDDKQIHLFKAPQSMTLVDAYVTCSTAMGTSKGAQLTLQNWGTGGIAVQTGGTITDTIGGSAAADAIAAATPAAFTIAAASKKLASGEWLVLDYQEQGDFQGGVMRVHVHARPGVSG